ncbi:hypothetical protein Leryth_001798 [Lithospermum erythrorhizon]|nr:hypothetical protein Leryth_001798 [Lithospermum erythrorhizon]
MELPFFSAASSGGGAPGDESLRWLAISEKLLSSRDLMGSKSFATRAREANPQVISPYQILAIVDTLMASEKRINNNLDWYSILQIQPTHDTEAIATQYRRLAVLLNPQKNQLPFADQAFRLVVEAFTVLSNNARKRVYDAEIGWINVNGLFGQSQSSSRLEQPQGFQFQMNNGGNNVDGSSVMLGFSGEMQNVGGVGGRDVSGACTGSVVIDEGRVEDVGEENGGDERVLGEDGELGGNETLKEVEGSFWTACPYCYHMFEYGKVYLDCTLRCQKCRKAFHGVEIVSPPPIVEGEEAYFCCWGYMPLAVSARDLGSRGGGTSNWTPFSPMFTSPPKPVNMGGGKSYDAPRFYHDDDDVYVELADSTEGSDDDWGASQRKKKT